MSVFLICSSSIFEVYMFIILLLQGYMQVSAVTTHYSYTGKIFSYASIAKGEDRLMVCG